MKLPKPMFSDPVEIRKVRKDLGMNQTQFWGRICVSQTNGCRYERGENAIPPPIQVLLHMAYAKEPLALQALGVLRAWEVAR